MLGGGEGGSNWEARPFYVAINKLKNETQCNSRILH